MRFVLIVLAVLICAKLKAQDIIVRITGDTLHVKVDSQNDTFVYYISSDSKRGEQEVISRREIAQILYNYESQTTKLKRKSNLKKRDYQTLAFYAQFSGYYLPNPDIPDDAFKEYYEELQFGTGYKAGANYFLTKQLGIGITYTIAKFSNSVPVIHPPTSAQGRLSDNLKISYYGANVAFRFDLGYSETNFMLSVGLGLNHYRNDGEIIYGYRTKAQNIGFHATAAFNLSLGGGLFIPVTLGCIGSQVGNISLEVDANMPNEFKESLEVSFSEGNSLSVIRFFAGIGLAFAF